MLALEQERTSPKVAAVAFDQSMSDHQRTAGSPRRGLPAWLDQVRLWPRLRWEAVAALVPSGMAAFVWAGTGLPAGAAYPWWGLAVDLPAGALAGLTLASFVPRPGTGRLIDVGCSPCAVASAASVFVALGLRSTNPTGGWIAMVGIAVLTMGLLRRLADAASCPAVAR
jgi:hypothetical protein